MKKIIILGLLLSSVSGFAINLNCKVYNEDGNRDSLYRFNLYNIENYEKISSDIPDTSTTQEFMRTDRGILKAMFSNECDNMYEVSFLQDELNDLIRKKLKTVVGKINNS